MLKRLLVLAVALTLFVIAFLVYFHVSDARVSQEFRAEREKFNVEGLNLTTTTPPTHETLTPTPPPPIPAAAVPVPSAATPGGTDAPLDSTLIVNPASPAASSPETNSPDAAPDHPAAPATNASPSTLIYPGLRQLPFVVMASYSTSRARLQEPTGTVAAPAVPAGAAPPVAPVAAGTNAVPPAPAAASAVTESETVRTTGNAPASVIVLGYHQFNPPGVRGHGLRYAYNMPQDVFDGEMKYLKDNNYHVVPLADVVRFAKGEITLPPGSVAVTIDDGYKSAIVYAAPVLKKYGFPWTFFIYPAFITTHESKGAASWSDLKELQDEGIDIECHSMTHPFLSHHRQMWKGSFHTLTPEEYTDFLTNETATAKAEIEQHLGEPVNFFAYPYGDHDPTVEARLIAAGFKAIFTVAGNPIHSGTNVYSMGRYVITPPVEKAFAAYLREGALGVADILPAPGSIDTDPRPIISAVLGYAGTIDPASITTEVRDMGDVRNDFDPRTDTLRIYLPRDLIDSAVVVDVRAKDAHTGQTMVASWRFNYQPTAAGVAHAPIGVARTTHAVARPAGVAPAVPVPAAATNTVESNAATAPVMKAASTRAAASNAAPIPAQAVEPAAPAPASNAVPPAPTTP